MLELSWKLVLIGSWNEVEIVTMWKVVKNLEAGTKLEIGFKL